MERRASCDPPPAQWLREMRSMVVPYDVRSVGRRVRWKMLTRRAAQGERQLRTKSFKHRFLNDVWSPAHAPSLSHRATDLTPHALPSATKETTSTDRTTVPSAALRTGAESQTLSTHATRSSWTSTTTSGSNPSSTSSLGHDLVILNSSGAPATCGQSIVVLGDSSMLVSHVLSPERGALSLSGSFV